MTNWCLVSLPSFQSPYRSDLEEECGVVEDVCLSVGRPIPSAFCTMSQALFCFLSGGPFSSAHAKWKMDSLGFLVYKKDQDSQQSDRQMGRQTKRWGEIMMDKETKWEEERDRRKNSEDKQARQSEKLRRGQQSLVGPWANRSQRRLFTLELWPIYWLTP